jgi:hypothetical protein
VTPKKFWNLCDSFGFHSKRTETSIEYTPDVINDKFATIVNNGSDLDNSDIPTDTQRSVDDLRSISILPCVSKIVERVIHNLLTRYLCSDNFQPRFRRNHSTTTALLKVSNDLRETINIGNVSFLLLLDFCKAFDKINHRRFTKKLRTFNLSESVVSWFVS